MTPIRSNSETEFMARGLEMSGKLAQIVMSNKTFPMVSSFFGHRKDVCRWMRKKGWLSGWA